MGHESWVLPFVHSKLFYFILFPWHENIFLGKFRKFLNLSHNPIFGQIFAPQKPPFSHSLGPFGASVKIGTIQRRLAWPLRKDDTQNREVLQLFFFFVVFVFVFVFVLFIYLFIFDLLRRGKHTQRRKDEK